MRFNSKFLHIAEKLSQRHTTEYRGIPLVIEWPRGSTRVGKDKDGNKWHREMFGDYGYVNDGSTAVGDHEPLDVYIGSEDSDRVFVIEQLKEDGSFDEYKAIFGEPDLESALRLYLKHYPDGWDDDRVGDISEVPFDYVFDKVKEHQAKTATADDPYLYHTTMRENLDSIKATGLVAGARDGMSMDGMPLANYLTEYAGLEFWIGFLDDYAKQLESDQDARDEQGLVPEILRVPRKGLKLKPDSVGSSDAMYPAYVCYDSIPPSKIQIQGENGWEPLLSYKTAARLKVVQGAGKTASPAATTKPVEHFVWISPRNDDRITKGNLGDHWKFQEPGYAQGRPLTYDEYDHSPRGYAEVRNDSKSVILSVTTDTNARYAFIPDSIVKEFRSKYPGYKMYKNGGKTVGLAYLNALRFMTS